MELTEVAATAEGATPPPASTEHSEVPPKTDVKPVEGAAPETSPALDTELKPTLPPKKKSAEERINELTWKRKEAEREAEFWKNKALEKNEAAPPKVEKDGNAPQPEDFEDTASFVKALVKYEKEEQAKTERAEKQREDEAARVKTFREKSQNLREAYEDYDEVVTSPVFTPTMRSVLLSSGNGPVLAYYLGRPENIAVAERIANMPSELQSYEIGKLETELLLAQKTKTITGAPDPIRPVGATGGAAPEDESKLSDDEWYKREQKRREEKLKAKLKGG